jgi:hypothetical protein
MAKVCQANGPPLAPYAYRPYIQKLRRLGAQKANHTNIKHAYATGHEHVAFIENRCLAEGNCGVPARHYSS